jgi:hypothetical protein
MTCSAPRQPPPKVPPVTRSEALAYMRYHWGQEYRFAYQDGHYTATSRNGDHATLTAEEPTDLLVQVRRHYKPPLRDRAST